MFSSLFFSLSLLYLIKYSRRLSAMCSNAFLLLLLLCANSQNLNQKLFDFYFISLLLLIKSVHTLHLSFFITFCTKFTNNEFVD